MKQDPMNPTSYTLKWLCSFKCLPKEIKFLYYNMFLFASELKWQVAQFVNFLRCMSAQDP